MITVAGRSRWTVRLTVARSTGMLEWAQVRGDFARALVSSAGRPVTDAEVSSESRRGRDHVAVTMTMTVTAADVADATAVAWRLFRLAAGADLGAWDLPSAAADVRPVRR